MLGKRIVYLVMCLLPLGLSAVVDYEVRFEGVQEKNVLDLLRSSSQLIKLQDHPPATKAALRRRANGDIPDFIKVLHSFAYFNAQVEISLESQEESTVIVITIEPGPVYPLAEFYIIPDEGSTFDFECLEYQDIGVTLGAPARPESILRGEGTLLLLMEGEGYPLARVTKREVVADQKDKVVKVTLYVESGPLGRFGPTTIVGNWTVKDLFFYKKLAWCRGDVYDPCKVDHTFHAIEASGLFSSVVISHAQEASDEGELPITIEVSESKHRSLGAGLSFTTQRGSGVTAEWEHRNVRSLGEKFNINTNIWTDTKEVDLLYVMPDYGWREQDFLLNANYLYEKTEGYTEKSVSFGGSFEYQYDPYTRVSYGVTYKQLRDSRSDNDGSYALIKTPLHLRWTNVKDILDPCDGASVYLSLTPAIQMFCNKFGYATGIATASWYTSLDPCCTHVLAAKGTIGSIIGSERRVLPPSERFYAGTESMLRGYKYRSVSPLDKDDKPIGGRSMVIFSFESRIRASESLGGVAFFDIGNVYKAYTPQLNKKMLKSFGIGIRYYTPVGPIRVDLAFPLNRRHHVDDKYEVYISVGQAF